MHRTAVNIPAPRMILICLHDGVRPFGPPRLSSAGAHCYLQHLLFILLSGVEVPDEAAIDLELAQIVVRGHVAAAVPAFIANAQIGDFVGSGMTVGSALFG